MTTMTPPTDTPPPGPPAGPPPGPPPAGPPPGWTPPPAGGAAAGGPPPGGPARRLQRSRGDRVAGGVAGGLGEYFGLDPVLFRVLFAVAAFFGGFGVVAYAVLWFALPETGDTSSSAVDRLGAWLRRHNVPLWLAGLVAVVVFWIFVGGFGGWAWHGFFFPGAAVVGIALLVVAFSRRGATAPPPPPVGAPGEPPAAGAAYAPTVSLTKPADATTDDAPMDSWYREACERGRQRRRRARPLFLATLGALLAGLAVVIVVDAVSGVALPVYALVGGGVVLVGLVAGIIARRPAYSLIWFLVPAVVWLAAFAGTHTSFRDGAGDATYRPTSAADLGTDYRLAFGRITLDLRDVYAGDASATVPRQVVVRVGAGVARVVLPEDADVTVVGQVRVGTVDIDGVDFRGEDHHDGRSGWRVNTSIAPRGTQGPPLVVVLQVTDGAALLDHVAS